MKFYLTIAILFCTSSFCNAQSEYLTEPEAYFSALIVSDIDRSIVWYSNNFGLKVLDKTESKERGFKQANLKRGNILIELIELKSAISLKDVDANINDKTRIIGFFKIGFLVSDFDNWISHLNDSKVDFHGTVVTDNISGKKMVIVKDPDGNRIQLFEK